MGVMNTGRVNKTQKKAKLKINDHTDLDSFRGGVGGIAERYKEKSSGSNSTLNNAWKKTSVSVKNQWKTLVIGRNKNENSMIVPSNSNQMQANGANAGGGISFRETNSNLS